CSPSLPVYCKVHVCIERRETPSLCKGKPTLVHHCLRHFPPGAHETKVIRCSKPLFRRPPLSLEGRQFGEEPSQALAHPVGKRRARHTCETCRIDIEAPLAQCCYGITDRLTHCCRLIFSLKGAQENCHH